MNRRTFRQLIILIMAVVALSSAAWAQEKMTITRFREIVASHGDSTPLNAKLAAAEPFWKNSTSTLDLKYADGKTFKETIPGTHKTVKGNYIVSTIQSELYKQPIDSIVAYDETAGCYKVWGLYGEAVAEGLIVYDFDKKTFSSHSTYGDGFLELGISSYSATNISGHTLILKNGVLFCTRDVNTVPAKPPTK
jgi:hypothetical protein